MSVDLSTTYMALELSNPIVASSSPLTGDLESLRALERAGVGAVVLPSVYEEQIEHEAMEMQRLMEQGTGAFAEALAGYFPEFDDYATRTEAYLRQITQAKEALSIPVIGSLNGTTAGGWVKYAKRIEEAGADALELNVYLIATDPEVTGAEIEERYLALVKEVREQVSIPLAVKIGPYFSSTPNMAVRLADAGADGLVLFNRFYQPDIDLESLEIVPKVNLSTSVALTLPLRWIGMLCSRVDADLAITSGVHTAEDAIKALLVGSNAVMMASALLLNGAEHVSTVIEEMRQWLDENEYESVRQMQGSMCVGTAPNPDAFVRANYMKMLVTYTSRRV
ncbi:MAG: dihydroorotate dehydrogenase-like protein [Actinomycetota bacterium]